MPPLLFIITGSQGAGKTTFCERLIDAAREAGWRTGGLLSRAVFEAADGGSQTRAAIQAEDISSGETRSLAVRSDTPTPGSKHWQFDPAALDWGSRVLAAATPIDFLVVDELGPLEFEREAGWQSGIQAVSSGQYAIALVVVRAEMLGEALTRWPDAHVVEIDTPEESARKAAVLAQQLF